MESEILTALQVADFLRVHVVTLARWRTLNKGPAWIEVEGQIRYRKEALETYLRDNTKNGATATNEDR